MEFAMRSLILCAVGTFAAMSAAPALANGDLFFHEHKAGHKGGTTYLGQVNDDSGNPIRAAQVSLLLPNKQTFFLKTDIRGRYRLTGVDKKLDARQVKVSVIKPGYKQLRVVNLTRNMKPGLPVEMNVILVRRP
jgi:hypothetical protein